MINPAQKLQLELKPMERTLTLKREAINEEERTIELSFSSEHPVERWFGYEILGHEPGECDLSLLNNNGAYLMDHNPRDQRGAIKEAFIDKKKGRAVVRLSKNERGEELLQDMIDGIRTHVSVGYDIQEIIHIKRDENERDWFRVTKWQPYEVSSVSVPADQTVGMGRNKDDTIEPKIFNVQLRGIDMGDTAAPKKAGETNTATPPANNGERGHDTPSPKPLDAAGIRKNEQQRCADIHEMGQQFGLEKEAQIAIREGTQTDAFREQVLSAVRTKQVTPTGTDMDLGLTESDVRSYSLVRAVRASASGKWKNAGFEREVSMALADKMGKDARGFYVNYEVLSQLGQRNKQSTADGVGGELVATELWSNQFIDMLRPHSIASQLGVRFATGLVGNVDIPKMMSGASFYWIDEDEDVTDSAIGLGMVKMSPKTIAGAVPMTRRILQQSTPDIDMIIRDELLQGIGLGIDRAVFLGTGTGAEPLGIKNQTGVHAIQVPAGGFDWKTIVDFETAVAESNALSANMAYAMRPSMRGALKVTEKSAGTAKYLWEGNQVNGYPGVVSTQLEQKAILHGDFSQALVGMWGALDLMIDKSTKAASGGTVLRAFQDADVAVRHGAAFGYGKVPAA
ncbi:phage major capsid protein [Vibrio sp. St2]|uniref:phage major capsid protein n=1 Tax=Vibrio sp. St2 TaxID=2853441 RepID=UPI00248E8D51|nr:phage major capsid protein [Vibrio sp. St2]